MVVNFVPSPAKESLGWYLVDSYSVRVHIPFSCAFSMLRPWNHTRDALFWQRLLPSQTKARNALLATISEIRRIISNIGSQASPESVIRTFPPLE